MAMMIESSNLDEVAAVGANASSGALKVGEVARMLRCHPSTVYRMLRRRELRAFKLGSDWRFLRADLENWMRHAAELNAGPAGPAAAQ